MPRSIRLERIFARDEFKCVFCGRLATTSGLELQGDHLMPFSKGGDGSASNIVTSCAGCNSAKTDRVLDKRTLQGLQALIDARNQECGIAYDSLVIGTRTVKPVVHKVKKQTVRKTVFSVALTDEQVAFCESIGVHPRTLLLMLLKTFAAEKQRAKDGLHYMEKVEEMRAKRYRRPKKTHAELDREWVKRNTYPGWEQEFEPFTE